MRYRLRTLMIVITLVCVWLGYHLHWMQQRRDALGWVEGQMAYWEDVPIQQGGAFPGASAPWRLRMLGTEGVKTISVMAYQEEELPKKRELARLFPEAQVRVYTPGPGYRGKRAR